MNSRKSVQWILVGLLVLAGLLLVPVGLLFAPILAQEWEENQFESQTQDLFERPISYIELQGDSATPYRIDDPERIEEFRLWISATYKDSSIRSAPAPAPPAYDLKLVFTDGSVESMKTGPFLEEAMTTSFDEVSFSWLSHDRVGGASELAAILRDPEQSRDP